MVVFTPEDSCTAHPESPSGRAVFDTRVNSKEKVSGVGTGPTQQLSDQPAGVSAKFPVTMPSPAQPSRVRANIKAGTLAVCQALALAQCPVPSQLSINSSPFKNNHVQRQRQPHLHINRTQVALEQLPSLLAPTGTPRSEGPQKVVKGVDWRPRKIVRARQGRLPRDGYTKREGESARVAG
ncbi:hypothetical protein CB1_000538011 [Camelus ferus]|nr:hypothetical protein CB1_000538011 [Camelus ferus]